MGFYYFSIIFFLACLYHDMYGSGSVTGFTYGYAAALVYYIVRAKEMLDFINNRENNKDDK